MTIPSRIDAARTLLGLDPPRWFLAHVSAVAEVAAYLARTIASRDLAVDRRLVESAALLHDVDKLLAPDVEARRLGHGRAGARWLTERGYREIGPAVAHHPVTRLADETGDTSWMEHASLEERIVAYADKRAGQRLMSMDARFGTWLLRHPEHAAGLARARRHADRLESEVCTAAGITPDQVRRLPWVRRTLAAAATSDRSHHRLEVGRRPTRRRPT